MQVVTLPDGEQYKSLEVLQQVWDKALQSRLDRNSTFVALGGGVIGDMCGFAAAAYQRGVHFIQVHFLSRLLLQILSLTRLVSNRLTQPHKDALAVGC